MTTLTTEETATPQATATGAQPKATKKARVAPRRARVAPKKGKAGKKAKAPKKTPKAAKKAGGARDGSKAAKILDLLKKARGRHACRDHESLFVAGSFREGLPLGDHSEEAGPERHLHQG